MPVDSRWGGKEKRWEVDKRDSCACVMCEGRQQRKRAIRKDAGCQGCVRRKGQEQNELAGE